MPALDKSALVPVAALLGATALAGVLLAAEPIAQNDRVAYPEGFATGFVRYATVDKPERGTVRFLYMSPDAFGAARAGEPLPEGTVLVMEDHAARKGDDDAAVTDASGAFIPTDEVVNVFVMEKRAGWGADIPEELRNGDWDYAWFGPDGARLGDRTVERCFECHLGQAGEDFTFTVMPFLARRGG